MCTSRRPAVAGRKRPLQADGPEAFLREGQAEARLFSMLQCLTPQRRHIVLQHRFSQGQRLALEQWMLTRRALLPRLRSALHPAEGAGAGERLSWNRWQQLFKTAVAAGAVRQRPTSELAAEWRRSRQPAKKKKKRGHSQTLRPHKLGACIGRRVVQGRVGYTATAVLGRMRLHTRRVCALEDASQMRDALDSIVRGCEAVLQARSPDMPSEEVLVETVGKNLTVATKIGLSVEVSVAARHWIGRELRTPRFPVARLSDALSAWRRLSEARRAVSSGPTNRHSMLRRESPGELEGAWQRLRAVYIDIWSEAGGKTPQAVAQHLRALESKHLPTRQRFLARWKEAAGKPSATGKLVRPAAAISTLSGGRAASCPGHSSEKLEELAEARIRRLLARWSMTS